MWYVIQDNDGPFMTEDKSVMEPKDRLLKETESKDEAKAVLDKAIEKWCRRYADDSGSETRWREV